VADALTASNKSKDTNMKYRSLGQTGIKVSPYCLGAMMFGAGGNPDHDETTKIIHKALDAGINFIDTADAYSRGESEEIVGSALRSSRRCRSLYQGLSRDG
jgi:aryl-alcohol dehydrogenase-like predicted oxidoreductase